MHSTSLTGELFFRGGFTFRHTRPLCSYKMRRQREQWAVAAALQWRTQWGGHITGRKYHLYQSFLRFPSTVMDILTLAMKYLDKVGLSDFQQCLTHFSLSMFPYHILFFTLPLSKWTCDLKWMLSLFKSYWMKSIAEDNLLGDVLLPSANDRSFKVIFIIVITYHTLYFVKRMKFKMNQNITLNLFAPSSESSSTTSKK